MHSALLVIYKPSCDEEQTKDLWQQFLAATSNIRKPSAAVDTLSETVLLIHVDSGLSVFAALVFQLDKAKYPYKVLFFDEEPRWVSAGISPLCLYHDKNNGPEHPAGRNQLERDVLPTERAGLAWTCNACGEELEGQFTECWQCGASRPVEEDP